MALNVPRRCSGGRPVSVDGEDMRRFLWVGEVRDETPVATKTVNLRDADGTLSQSARKGGVRARRYGCVGRTTAPKAKAPVTRVAPAVMRAVAIRVFFMASSCMRLQRVSRAAEPVLYTHL